MTAFLTLGLAATAPAVAQQDDGQKRVTTIDHAIEFYLSDNALEAKYVRNLDLGDLGLTEARAGFFYNEDRDLIAMGDEVSHFGRVGEHLAIDDYRICIDTEIAGPARS